MLPTLDRSAAPLIAIHFPPVVTKTELDTHFAAIDALALAAETPGLALVVDLTEANLLAAETREHLVARMRAGYPLVAGRIVGVAHVVASALTLAAMRTVWWLAPPPFATFVTRSSTEAFAWGRARLERPTPPRGSRFSV